MKDKYKRAQEWCNGCDGELVPIGVSCTQCGWTNKKKLHKPHNSELINEYNHSITSYIGDMNIIKQIQDQLF